MTESILTGLSISVECILPDDDEPLAVAHETSLAHITADLPGNAALTAPPNDSLSRKPCTYSGLGCEIMMSLLHHCLVAGCRPGSDWPEPSSTAALPPTSSLLIAHE